MKWSIAVCAGLAAFVAASVAVCAAEPGSKKVLEWGWGEPDTKFLRQNIARMEVRAALAVSDRYVWIYTEKPLWWTNQRLPRPYVDALRAAREPKR
jgi:hypothetical protein